MKNSCNPLYVPVQVRSIKYAGTSVFSLIAGCLTFLFIFLLPVSNNAQVKTFTVNTTGDESDPNAGNLDDDGACDVDPSTPGDQCTLRAAIENQNGNRNLGQNEIKFNIPNAPGSGSIIINVGATGLGPLPNVLGSVIIKAKNQGDNRRIELNGSMAGANATGLKLLGGQCQIYFFIINNFSSYGIFISGTPPPGEGSHVIRGNYIGTDATGKISKGNGADGIYIDNTGNDTIGGTAFDDLNIISGNKGYGIVIHGSNPAVDFQTNGARNNMVAGNFIGLDIDGNLVLPNEKGGILDDNAPNNRIGDSTNVKAGNKLAGVKNGITVMGSLSEGVGIEGNFFQNGSGAKFSAGIFGRGGKGLYITGNLLDDIDSTAIDLFVDANGGYNIRKNRFQGSINTGTKIRFGAGRTAEIDYVNNFNVGAGMAIDAEESINSSIDWLFIGDTMRAGQAGANIIFRASGKKNFSNNRWESMANFGLNYVTDLSSGVQATLAETNEFFANNGAEGLHGRIQGTGELALTLLGNKSTGNGTDGSRLDVFVSAGAKVDITARGNEYTFCGRAGLRVTGDGQKLDLVNFIFEKNLIDHDNFFGLELFNSAILKKSITNNTITNNGGPGIQLDGNSDAHIDNNTITGNATGILINDASTAGINNNTISANNSGIALAGTGTGTFISDNLIFNNNTIGIDLGNDGVTLNDAGDIDTGPDNLQNFPVITSVNSNGSNTNIQGTLNSMPNATFRIEFFSNTSCSPSGFGEGQTFLGFDSVTTDATGNAAFSATLAGIAVSNGSSVTSTATDASNNTSEFSKCFLFGTTQTSDLTVIKTANKTSLIADENAVFTITLTNKGPNDATGIAVTDVLPGGISFTNATASQGSYDAASGTWAAGSLTNGNQATLTLTTIAAQAGSFTNTATITASDQSDNNFANNTSSVTITVQPRVSFADLQINKTVNKTSVIVGETFTYTVTLTNNGLDDATGISISDIAPPGISFGQVTASAGSYDSSTGRWTINSLSNGSHAILTIVATATQAGAITNTASVTASNVPDPNLNNNTSSVTITIQQVTSINKEIQNLIDSINSFISSGELTRFQGNILIRLLKITANLHHEGNDAGAINFLRVFRFVVNLLLRNNQLSARSGQYLLNAAKKITDDIRGNLRSPIITQQSLQKNNLGLRLPPSGFDNALTNYPNPFNTETVISFSLQKTERVQLNIYDDNGRLLTRLLDKIMLRGTHYITWQAANAAAGIYTVQLIMEKEAKTHRMIHIK
jgi:uncharacterized repeat protein (TIGR01451 family)/CSLREA domain-containing protein